MTDMKLDSDDRKSLETVKALCEIASSNFPGNTDIRISVVGGPSVGSVTLQWYVMAKAIRIVLAK